VLESLRTRTEGPFVARLPREPRRKDHAWAHLFGGPIESVPQSVEPAERAAADRAPTAAGGGSALAALEARVAELERSLGAIKNSLGID
jgi:uncharacterized protein YceH (UPF0502 family)